MNANELLGTSFKRPYHQEFNYRPARPYVLRGLRLLFVLHTLSLAIPLAHGSEQRPPTLLYTDITSGPNTGGENNNGIYLSIFGKYFGNDISKIQVFIGGAEVAAYNYLGRSLGRTDIQQLVVQPGPKSNTGKIRVVVDGRADKPRLSFTVRTGNIFFTSLTGNDRTGRIGNIHKPFRHVQTVFDRSDFGPGDFIIMRGGNWHDLGRYKAFLTVYDKTGTLDRPFTISAYPGERTIIQSRGRRGGINFYETHGGITFSGLRINGNGNDVIQLQAKSNNVRIVNNEIFGLWKKSGGSAGIVGNGKHWRIFGNSVHDNGYSKLFHGIYIDNDHGNGSDDIEIAYNHIFHQTGGRGIQIYWRTPPMTNIAIHDNLIHDIDRDGILISDNAGDGIRIFNNVIYRTGLIDGSAIRINSKIANVDIFNNTLFDAAVAKTAGNLYFENASSISLHNNIIFAVNRQHYMTFEVPEALIRAKNNLWYGAGPAPSIDDHPLQQDPLFNDIDHRDFHIGKDFRAIYIFSKVDSVGPLDFDGVPRSSKSFNVGAYEFHPQNNKLHNSKPANTTANP